MARSSRWKDASASAQGSVPPPGTPVAPAQPQAPAPSMQMPAPPAPAPYGAPQPPAQPYPAPTAPFAPQVGAAANPGAPSASSNPVEGEVAELKSTLADLAATVASLVERTQAGPASAAPAAGGTNDTDQVSRIIVMANRTAETTIEDARAEAATIVAGAKTQSFEIIRMARELANQELAAERDRVARSTEAWIAKRAEVTEQLRALETTFHGYQSSLGGVGESIRSAVVQLESDDSALPVIDELPAPDPSAFIGTELPDATTSDDAAVVAGDESSDEVIDLTEGAVADTDAAEATDAAGAEPGVEPSAPATPGRTSLFGGSPTLPGGTQGAPPAWPAPEAADAAEEPGSNLRPGLFGR